MLAGAWLLALIAGWVSSVAPAHAAGADATAIRDRHIGAQRTRATNLPRSEGDQALVDGWPLYRTERGQEAFNDAMATLAATEAAAPAASVFKGCDGLACNLTLPRIGADGWIPAGRIWVSPTEYVLIAHSPRQQRGGQYRRRDARGMRVFVLHEFHNGSRNNDPYDTISAHRGSVFVPLYMSKQGSDAKGRRYVVIVQVAPYDVVSVHASNRGSAGPGIEVAKNVNEALEPLQGLAGIVVAGIVKAAAPQVQVINHRGAEGQPMLTVYERRLAALRVGAAAAVTLPFVAAPPQKVAGATGQLAQLIVRKGLSPPVPVAERGFLPPKGAREPVPEPGPEPAVVAAVAKPTAPPVSKAVSALGNYLAANLAAIKRHPAYAGIFPDDAVAVLEEAPDEGIVFVVDAAEQTLGHIEAFQVFGNTVKGKYIWVPLDRPSDDEKVLELDFSKPVVQAAVTTVAPKPQR